MRVVHTYDLGDRVNVFQMSPSKGLLFEGRAWITEKIDDLDERYMVRFDNAENDDDTYERFVDTQGQGDPQEYIREFNKRLVGIPG